jgi:endonuclease-8
VTFAPDKFPHLQTVSRKLANRVIVAIEARGKAILTHFAGGLSIYSHNQLYGQWQVFEGAPPTSHLQTRLTIATTRHTVVLYSASSIEVLITRDANQHPYLAKLGIELLDPSVTLRQVRAHLAQARFAKKSLGVLLLDQACMAGIGNYLRSEILFLSGLRPEMRIAQLSVLQASALARHALAVTRQAYRTQGITNDPALATQLQAAGWSFAQARHWVFDRAGQPCHRCRSEVERGTANGRGIYLCPQCQPPRLLAS